MVTTTRRFGLLTAACLATVLLPAPASANAPLAASDTRAAAELIRQFKTRRMGPFDVVRWFCNDGTELVPKPYACKPHGGGHQHGRLAADARSLRDSGLMIGNVLAGMNPEWVLQDQASLLKAILIEQYLIAIDDGWILRRAREVRGVLQAEDEAWAAAQIMEAMSLRSEYRGQDLLLLRETFRRLPDPTRSSELDTVRAQAVTLDAQDAGFAALRAKVHSRPDATDAAAVRDYARGLPAGVDTAPYEQLAQSIDRLFANGSIAQTVAALAKRLADKDLQALAARLGSGLAPGEQLQALADLLQLLQQRMQTVPANSRMRVLAASVAAEEAAFVAARSWTTQSLRASRAERLNVLASLVRALEGSGLINSRERAQVLDTLPRLDQPTELQDYRAAVERLARVPVWAANRLNFHFLPVLRRFTPVEPLAGGFVPDRLRASPALVFGEVLQQLQADVDRLTGVSHRFLGEQVTSGLRALNPGLARGVLSILDPSAHDESARGIVLAPESAADLPPVAGILTAHEGNALSHVQLLARNLGVPNVVIAPHLIELLQPLIGQRLVVAVSAGGAVEIDRDSAQWDQAFPAARELAPSGIQIDVNRLDLAERRFLPLRDLRAEDSGRSVGPKAAKLGELMHRYPDHVSPGLAIPFGRFRAVLDSPLPESESSLFDWMRQSYARLANINDAAQNSAATAAFLAKVRERILQHRFSPEFVFELRRSMETEFGPIGSFGVFVRSDTNVEDLPGFTGAGLNLTLPNVVGMDATLDAIRRVWASPFTERAYGWRQAQMDKPEHVYTSVLLHRSVLADLSGVMITADLSSGDRSIINLATNEGVGGGVEGQAAESLRVHLETGELELLATAAEPTRRVLLEAGGSALVPASGQPELLDEAAIGQLLAVARSLPERYPSLVDAQNQIAPADIEFAIAGQRLYLNQIRPFLQSDRARRNAFLLSMDGTVRVDLRSEIDLQQRPR